MNTSVPPPFPTHSPNLNETLSLIHMIYVGLLGLSSGLFLYMEYQEKSVQMPVVVIVLGIITLLIYFNLKASHQVKQGLVQGRTLSRIMAGLMLLSFPIGTVLGALALWRSAENNWQDKN